MAVHLFLDWSGTLCDDLSEMRKLANTLIRSRSGVQATPEEFRLEFHPPLREFFAKRIPSETIPSEEDLLELFDAAAALLPPPALFPGVHDFLRRARASGGTVHILSAIPQKTLDRLVDDHELRDLVTEVAGGLGDKAQALPALVARSGLSPDDCLMLGDTPYDLAVARAARLRACVVLHGYAREEILRHGHPDEVWQDLHEATAWLDRHLMLETRSWPIATVGGLVFRDDGRAYFVRTAKWSGRWGTPGGKIDYGERHLDAFVREIREETGIDTADPELVLVQDAVEEPEFVRPRHFLLLNMVGRALPLSDSVPEEGRLNHESLEGGWFTLEEAAELDLNRPTRVLVDFLRARRQGG